MAQMLNHPAFLTVPSGFSTISVWLRGRLEICAKAGHAISHVVAMIAIDRSRRIGSSPGCRKRRSCLGALLRARGYRALPGRSNAGLICIRESDPKRSCSSPKVQAHLDVLVVVAEAATEDVEAARTLRLLGDTDLEPDRVMRGEVELIQGDARHALA